MREICQTLGFNKSTFYYQPKLDASEAVLRAEIHRFAAAYPTYGYRRITALVLRQGYTVGYKRVFRLMKEENLSVSVKRVRQTTRSLAGQGPWVNRVENLEISQEDQVWVADITYVRLKQRFIYVALLMDVFTRVIKAWRTSESTVEHISDLETLGRRLTPQRPGDSSFRSRCAVSFKGVSLGAQSTRY